MRSFLDLELKRLSFCTDRKDIKQPMRIEVVPVVEPVTEPKEAAPVDVT